MEIIELLLDEESPNAGIEAISIVENGAIESDFIAMANQEIQMAQVDKEQKLLMGAALIPDKPIYRKLDDKEYYVYFSKETVKKASQLFFMNGNQNNATLEHKMQIKGLTVVESWLVEDKEMDKSKSYGLNVPKGTWMVTMKVNNDEIWNEYVKEGKVKGFSIEGYFADKGEIREKMQNSEEEIAKEKIEQLKNLFKETKLSVNVIDEDFAIIDDRLAYSKQEKAEEMAYNIGCEGYHEHEFEGKTWYMACEKHTELKKPCYDGYEMIGFKTKNGRRVPNCVPIS